MNEYITDKNKIKTCSKFLGSRWRGHTNEDIKEYAEYYRLAMNDLVAKYPNYKELEAQLEEEIERRVKAEGMARVERIRARLIAEEAEIVDKHDGSYYFKIGSVPRAEYKRLAKVMHPDMGGTVEQMQRLNALRRVG